MKERKSMIKSCFFSFSHRLKLGEAYKKWIKENNFADTPASVIAYLQIIGVLDEQKALEFVNSLEGKTNETNI